MLNVRTFLACVCISWCFGILNAYAADTLDTAKIEKLTGHKGVLDQKENTFKVSVPRKDIKCSVGQTKVNPTMGLTSWASFMKMGDHVMAMGDMVVLENQVNPVMSTALDNGLQVTGLHNHFLWDSPRIMFMHISGIGEQTKIAEAVGKVFAKIDETASLRNEAPKASIDPTQTNLDPNKIEAIFGKKGQLSSGVHKWTFGRTTKMHGQEVGNTMGINTWAAFVGTDDNAIVDGDFAMYESEVQNVLKTLRHAGINIVAIHNHMIMEEPRVIFLHFWGVGKTTDLAQALKAAMDTQQK